MNNEQADDFAKRHVIEADNGIREAYGKSPQEEPWVAEFDEKFEELYINEPYDSSDFADGYSDRTEAVKSLNSPSFYQPSWKNSMTTPDIIRKRFKEYVDANRITIAKEFREKEALKVLPVEVSYYPLWVLENYLLQALRDREKEIVAGIEGKLCSDCKDKLENHAL